MKLLIGVLGIDTEIGKTVATTALAQHYLQSGHRVHVDKPVQTGVEGDSHEPADIDTVHHHLGTPTLLSTSEGQRLAPAMAPRDASTVTGEPLKTAEEHIERWASYTRSTDVLIAEGAGGLTVRLTEEGLTLWELIKRGGNAFGIKPMLILVTHSGLGTQNHTELALDHLASRNQTPEALIISNPQPDLQPQLYAANARFLHALALQHGIRSVVELPRFSGNEAPRLDLLSRERGSRAQS